jgi:hypothetical protein
MEPQRGFPHRIPDEAPSRVAYHVMTQPCDVTVETFNETQRPADEGGRHVSISVEDG